jgi:hypothetical protein
VKQALRFTVARGKPYGFASRPQGPLEPPDLAGGLVEEEPLAGREFRIPNQFCIANVS